jgi:hypothetical protein
MAGLCLNINTGIITPVLGTGRGSWPKPTVPYCSDSALTILIINKSYLTAPVILYSLYSNRNLYLYSTVHRLHGIVLRFYNSIIVVVGSLTLDFSLKL